MWSLYVNTARCKQAAPVGQPCSSPNPVYFTLHSFTEWVSFSEEKCHRNFDPFLDRKWLQYMWSGSCLFWHKLNLAVFRVQSRSCSAFPRSTCCGCKWPFPFIYYYIKPFKACLLSEASWGHAATAQHSLSICTVTFCLGRDLFTLCIQIFADAPESCPLSPAAPVFSAPTRQSKKLSRHNRPLAVYNPQALDIQNGKRRTHVHLYIFHLKPSVKYV